MPRKFKVPNTVDRVLVELWVNDIKTASVNVEENYIHTKAAEFKEKAIREEYMNWTVYVVRPCMKPGVNLSVRKLSKEMQAKWKESMKKIYKT